MSRTVATYRGSVAGGLRVACGPLALVAHNVGALAARSYRVGVRDPDDRVVAIHGDSGHLHLSFHSRPGASATPPPWVGRLSDLLAQIAPPPTPTLK